MRLTELFLATLLLSWVILLESKVIPISEDNEAMMKEREVNEDDRELKNQNFEELLKENQDENL